MTQKYASLKKGPNSLRATLQARLYYARKKNRTARIAATPPPE